MYGFERRSPEMRLTFTDFEGNHIEHVFGPGSTPDILAQMRLFLLGCGWPVEGSELRACDEADITLTPAEYKALTESIEAEQYPPIELADSVTYLDLEDSCND